MERHNTERSRVSYRIILPLFVHWDEEKIQARVIEA